jgi:peptide-methionine (S)-S-oxide reductase
MGDHTEALQVDFDPSLLSYQELLDVIWAEHDPSAPPRSVQYRAVILTADEAQARQAEASRQRLAERMGREVQTPLEALGTFTRAEDYHQKYRLRQWPALYAELLQLCGDERAFVDSTAAARLNGYLAGYGAPEALERDLASVALQPSTRAAVLERVQARGGRR